MDKSKILDIIKLENVEKANVVATFYNKVCIGIYENEDFKFDEDVNYSLCNEIRVFNKELEIRIVIKNDNIYSKKITDDNKIDSFDEDMFLREDSNKKIKVRNYLTIDENNQVIIEDSRLVEFIDEKEV